MAGKKKGKSYKIPKVAPRGYKPKPNDGVTDYTQKVQRAKLPRTRKRYVKADGFDVEIVFEPDKRPSKSKTQKKGTRKGKQQ